MNTTQLLNNAYSSWGYLHKIKARQSPRVDGGALPAGEKEEEFGSFWLLKEGEPVSFGEVVAGGLQMPWWMVPGSRARGQL